MKFFGIGLIALSIGAFIGSTQIEYEKSTGRVLFLSAIGWQLAGNALYAYEHLPLDSIQNTPFKFQQLQATIKQHIDSLTPMQIYLHTNLNYFYQYDKESPLYTYMETIVLKDSGANALKRWSLAGALYREYGFYLIKKHPTAFFQYFIKPNLVYFYTPKTEFLANYNMANDTVDNLAVHWFGFKNKLIPNYKKGLQIKISNYFPIVLAIINMVFLLSFIGFWLLGGGTKTANYTLRVFLLAFLLWLINFCFSVLAAPIVLRYQLFPMIITFTFGGLLMSFIIQKTRSTKIQKPILQKEDSIQREAVVQ